MIVDRDMESVRRHARLAALGVFAAAGTVADGKPERLKKYLQDIR